MRSADVLGTWQRLVWAPNFKFFFCREGALKDGLREK